MYKVIRFGHEVEIDLQEAINEWILANPDHTIESFSTIYKEGRRPEYTSFVIFRDHSLSGGFI